MKPIYRTLFLMILIAIFSCYFFPSYSQEIDITELADSVILNDSLANDYAEKGDLRKAQEYALKNIAINKGVLGENSVPYAVAILKYARYLYSHDRDKDDRLSNKGLFILKDSLGTKSSIYIKYLLEYAWRQFNFGQIQDACNTIKDAAEENYDDGDFYLGYLYYSYAHFLKELGEGDKARKHAKMAESFFNKKEMWSDDYYTMALIDLAYLSAPNQELSLSYLRKAKNIVENLKGRDCVDYLDVILKIAYFYRATNQQKEALDYAKQAKEIGERIKEMDYGSYLYTLEFLAGRYSALKQYDKAAEYAEECLNLMKESKEIALEDRLPTLDSLIVYYSSFPNFEKINLYAKEAYLIRKSCNIEGDDLVKNLYYLLHSNYYLAKYEECELNLNEIKEMYGDYFSSGYKHYYDDMDILMHSFLNRKLYNKAIDVSIEIEKTCKQQYGEENEYLPRFIMNRANIYTYLGEMDEYYRWTTKALDMIKRLYGKNSSKYLYNLHSVAISLYNVGYYDQAYDMFKKTASLANNLYGKMNIFFVTNYLSAMLLWNKDRGVLFDDYNLNDLYKYLLFLKIIYNLNNSDYDPSEKMLKGLTDYVNWSFPNLLIKNGNSPSSISALYKCLTLSKSNIINKDILKDEIGTELGKDSIKLLVDFCKTNSAYIVAHNNLEPEQLDSLYKQSTYYIESLSKGSPTFCNYIKGMAVMDSLINNLLENEAIIDFLPLSHFGTGYIDYVVIMDRKKECPEFIPSTIVAEGLNKTFDTYETLYFVFDNDSVLSIFNINDINTQCVVGYDPSIAHILNRGHMKEKSSQDVSKQLRNSQLPYFSFAINEFERGVDLYNRKKYDIAIKAFSQCDSLMYLAKGESSAYYGHGKEWIASCLYKMGNDSLSKKYSQYYFLEPIDMRQTIMSDSVLDIATLLYENGNIKEALEKYDEASKLEQSKLGKNSYWYANTLSHCADICIELGEYKRAIEYELRAIEIRRKRPGVNHIDYYFSLQNLFTSYESLDSDNKTELIKYGELLTEFMEKNSESLREECVYYPLYAYSMARIYTAENKKEEALEYCKKAIDYADNWTDMSKAYTLLCHNIIFCFKILGEDSLAFKLCEHIIPIFEKDKELQNDEYNNYSDILNIIANHYYSKGDFVSACVYQEKAVDLLKDKSVSQYGTSLSNLALTYCESGRIEEAIEKAEEAVRISENDNLHMGDTLGIGIYANRLTNLAHCYSVANRPKEALKYGKKTYQILTNSLGIDNYGTLLAANNLAQYYNELGYSEEAKDLLFLVVEHAGKDLQKNGVILGTAYNNLGMGWAREMLDYQASLDFVNKSYEIRKEYLGVNNLLTIESLYNKGRCLLDIGKVSEGVYYITKALSQTKDIIGENNLRYVEMMKIMTTIYGNAGEFNRALKMEEERSVLLKRIVGEQHIAYIRSLETLSELLFYTGETDKLYNTIIEESNKYRKMIISDFPNYTSLERANAVNCMGRFYDWLFPLVCYYKNQPQICSELYNALLLRKGLLLNSEIEFGRLINESGDSALVRRYNDLIANKNVLNKQYQMPVEHRTFNVDSLRLKINEEEDYLVSASKEYGEYTKRFNVNWEDIKGQLNDDELCVEFVVFDDTCSIQNQVYYALLVEKKCETPIFVPLCNENQIKKALRDGGNAGELYQLIWDPIIRNCNNSKTIYFSPSGILNTIGIEYVDINEYENITEKYNLHRLSSTREIINKPNSICKTAALYGGLDYSVDTEVLLAQNKANVEEGSLSLMYRGLSDSLAVRNSFEPLYNTKSEISEIGKTLKNGDIEVSMYSETYGTEESFKELSGKGLNLIHLATHGMYIGGLDAEKKKRDANLTFIQLDDSEMGTIQEDKSLSRSFLVMFGGDMLPTHKDVPGNLEDGILTAYEISKLDLRGLDLVVLSACQTALGDVNYEGVYGLQRGFKKAGANTILMSLDKVDDEATKILMVEFYRNLMSGKSKHQSLKDAQKYLRQVEKGKYNRSEYWASFIMLDGLN